MAQNEGEATMKPLRIFSRWIPVAIAIFSFAVVPTAAQPRGLPSETVEAVEQAVVLVNVTQEGAGRVVRGSGSGVIIDQAGVILTAAHVVAQATRIEVKLRSGDMLRAQVVGVDPVFDAALLRIEPRQLLPVVPLGTSATLRRGDPVTAFGRAPSRGTGPTLGAFLWVDLEVRPGSPFLATTAKAYHGDSGGALVNVRGELVGIMSDISRDGLVSFSVAIDAIKGIYPDLLTGLVHHSWIGVVGETITSELVQQLGLPVRRGVFVLEVIEGSPAALAGLLGGQATAAPILPRGGDIITGIDSRPIQSYGELAAYILSKRIGETVTLQVFRGGRIVTVPVVLSERPVR